MPDRKVVSAVVLDDLFDILAVESAKDNRLGLPGGKVEPGERPSVAVKREVTLEETGVGLILDSVLGRYISTSRRGNKIVNIAFLAHAGRGRYLAPALHESNAEIEGIYWLSFDEAAGLKNDSVRTNDFKSIIRDARDRLNGKLSEPVIRYL